ncbi:hypothetical protein [Streptomyces graminofaciens]|nr:hypothetical protein [Streptomyces graminofaciens]
MDTLGAAVREPGLARPDDHADRATALIMGCWSQPAASCEVSSCT